MPDPISLVEPELPPYGSGTLAEVTPALASLIDGSAEVDRIGLPVYLRPAQRVCLLLVDGLGWDALTRFPGACPTLTALTGDPASGSRRISTCFPSTTVCSLASVGTGLPPGEHGLVGYTIWWPQLASVVNLIQFSYVGASRRGSVADYVMPEVLQPHDTVFQRLEARGIPTITVSNTVFEGSPLTRAALRGPAYTGWRSPEETVDIAVRELVARDRCFAYAYHPDLDRIGHEVGTNTGAYAEELARVDAMVARLVEELPPGTVLAVTGDHGMLDIAERDRIPFDRDVDLERGVLGLGGEPRMRHVYAEPGEAHRVFDTWRRRFGEIAWVARREDAISAGWFGPIVEPRVRPYIGDVVVAFDAPYVLVQPEVDPLQAQLRGHHGSFTSVERYVPLLLAVTPC